MTAHPHRPPTTPGDGVSGELAGRVGTLIREMRRARGLSLSEVARRAGLGKATLSELEGGRRNPTLETLFAITRVLGLPLSAVIPVEEARGVGPVAPQISGAAVDSYLLERFDDRDVITEVFRLRIRQGTRQLSPAHAPGVREYLTVFAGTALVGDPGAPLVVHSGEHATWAASRPHLYAAADADVEGTLVMRYPRTSTS